MSNMNNNYQHIPQDRFEFVQLATQLHDSKLETKARNFFQDAMLRFSKNKSSVVAAWILLFLVIFSLISPLISPYDITDNLDADKLYVNFPSYVPALAKYGIMDGGRVLPSQNDNNMLVWKAMALETGQDPINEVVAEHTIQVMYRGKLVDRTGYDLEINRYLERGIEYMNFSYEDFQKVQAWQNESGIQVIYPWVEPSDINDIKDNPDLWYKVDSKGAPKLDKNGNFVSVYCSTAAIAGAEYNSLRIEGDPGT